MIFISYSAMNIISQRMLFKKNIWNTSFLELPT